MPVLTAVREVRTDTSGLIALPAGTAIGNAVIITTSAAGSASIGTGADQIHTTIVPEYGDPGSFFYFGVIDRLDPIQINIDVGSPGQRSAHAQMLTIDGQLDMRKVSMNGNPVTSSSDGYTIVDPIVGRVNGAIVTALWRRGIGGANWSGVADTVTAQNWNYVQAADNYNGVGAAWVGDQRINNPVKASITGVDSGYITALMVGVYVRGAAAPCRLIRDDDLGVGGARLYPPPRSQQRSSRGVGYY